MVGHVLELEYKPLDLFFGSTGRGRVVCASGQAFTSSSRPSL